MKTIHAAQALLPEGWRHNVAITLDPSGRIASVEPDTGYHANALPLVLPAPVNLHSHAFQRAMSGLTEARGPDPRDSFWSWRRLMYRFLDRLTPDQVEAIATLVFMEMLEAGYGAVAEFHYLHHQVGGTPYDNIAEMAARIVQASQTAGIGLTLLPVFYAQGGCDGRPLEGGQLRFGNDMTRFARLHGASAEVVNAGPEDAAIGVAPHSLRAVSPRDMEASIGLSPSGPIHLHLAEQTAEVQEVEAHLDARPTEWLLANHDVDERWCLIHCTQMTSLETKSLASTGAVAGLCPITESSLGDGIFNGVEFAANTGRFGVGSDSNIHISLFGELTALEYSQRLRDRSRAAFATSDRSTGRFLFETVAQAGASAAARDAGAIRKGCWADLVALDARNPWVCDRRGDAVLDSLIFSGRGQDCITNVWSAGRHVVENGRHVKRDQICRQFLNVVDALGQGI